MRNSAAVSFCTSSANCTGVENERLETRSAELLEHLELTPWKDELVESYSHGMKQRLVVCAALIHDPRILVVDEPMVGMDPKGARTLKDLFRALARKRHDGFSSTHSIGVAEEICHRIGIIQKGRLIACGTMSEIHAQTARQRQRQSRKRFLELTREQDMAVRGAPRALIRHELRRPTALAAVAHVEKQFFPRRASWTRRFFWPLLAAAFLARHLFWSSAASCVTSKPSTSSARPCLSTAVDNFADLPIDVAVQQFGRGAVDFFSRPRPRLDPFHAGGAQVHFSSPG